MPLYRLSLAIPLAFLLPATGAVPVVAPAAASAPAESMAEVLVDADHDTVPDQIGRRVHVRGTVLVAPQALRSRGFATYITDGTGGLGLFDMRTPQVLAPGDRVDVIGEVAQYKGQVQLERFQLTRLGAGPVPRPVALDGEALAKGAGLGRLVRLAGSVASLDVGNFAMLQLTAADGYPAMVYVPAPVAERMDWNTLPPGTEVAVTGVEGIHKLSWPYDSGYQIVLRSPRDLTVTSRAAPAWQGWLLRGMLATAVLLGIGLVAFQWLQGRRRARERELKAVAALSEAFARPDLTEEQLARQACEILTGHCIVDAAIVCLFDARGRLDPLAASAADPSVCNTLDLADLRGSAQTDPGDTQRIRSHLREQGLTLLAAHPLVTIAGTRGFLVGLSPRRGRPSAMQERTLLAAVKLLAMALETAKIQQQARVEHERMQRQAVTDALTRLYNRRYLDEYLKMQLPLAGRHDRGLAFLAIDVDHFKQINDSFGHAVGDRVLVGLATILRRSVRSGDLPVRVGGEEFLLILPGADIEAATAFADRLRASVEAHDFERATGLSSLHVTISVGVALYGLHGSDAQTLLRMADEAMYASKRAGRNRVTLAQLPGTAAPASEPTPG